MPQSVARVALHLVYSTKNRVPLLKSGEIRQQLYAYIATILKEQVDSPAIIIGGVEDHIHILCSLSRKYPIMKLIEESKKESTKWLKKQDSTLSEFSWQNGYGAFGVSESHVPDVKRYIANQVEWHQKLSFQDEFRRLCERHGIDLDEKYAWD